TFGSKPIVSLSATAIEMVFAALSGFSIYLLAQGLTWTDIDSRLRGIVIGIFVLTLAVPLWTPILHRGLRLIQTRTGASTLASFSAWDGLRILGILALAWIGGGFLLYMIANAVTPLSFAQLPNIIGSWGAAGAISMTAGLLVQGMGLREVTLAVLLSSYMPLPAAAVVSLLFRLLLTVGESIWALVIAWLVPWWPK
ncbi:MAG: hypothetical protein KKC18_04255, partial [Chloroflexi bacterium]|nr:hypothetical protein [Chloroflexota bacterium]